MNRRAFLSIAGLSLAIAGQVVVGTPGGEAFGLGLLAAALAVAFFEAMSSSRSARTDAFGALICGVIGVSLWREPRGWFFLGLALIWLFSVALRRSSRRSGATSPGTVSDDVPDGTALDEASIVPAVSAPAAEPGRVVLGVVYGAAVATVGAVAWFLFSKLTGWSLGLIAVIIGHLVGRAVLIGTRRRSRFLQLLSAGLGGLGIFGGEYLIVRDSLLTYLAGQGYTQVPERLVVAIIAQSIVEEPEIIGVMGFVFIVIGIYEAWRVPRPAIVLTVSGHTRREVSETTMAK